MALDFLNPFILPLFSINPLLGLVFVVLLISLFSTLVYKYTTDQILIKRIKREMKELNEKAKASRDDPEKLMAINKEIMSKSMKQFGMTFKSSMFTMIPMLLIFLWLGSHLAFAPIVPDQEFSISVFAQEDNITLTGLDNNIELISKDVYSNNQDKKIDYTFVAKKENNYLIEFDDNVHSVKVTNDFEYSEPSQKVENQNIKSITTNQNKMIFLNIFGWKLGWFGSYFILTIISTMLLRKLLDVQ